MTLANGDRNLRPYVGPNGEGWRQIVDVLVVASRKIDPDYRIHDVKEKFGGLRFSTAWTQDNDNADAFRNLAARPKPGRMKLANTAVAEPASRPLRVHGGFVPSVPHAPTRARLGPPPERWGIRKLLNPLVAQQAEFAACLRPLVVHRRCSARAWWRGADKLSQAVSLRCARSCSYRP